MIVKGTVIDANTRQPVEGATVALDMGSQLVAIYKTNADGSFQVEDGGAPIVLSHSGYVEMTIPLPHSSASLVYEMIPDYKELPEVVVTAKKTNWLIFAAVGIFLFFTLKKRK